MGASVSINRPLIVFLHHVFIHSFIHSGYFYHASSKSSTTQGRSWHSTDTVPKFHDKEPQATVSEGLPKVPTYSVF